MRRTRIHLIALAAGVSACQTAPVPAFSVAPGELVLDFTSGVAVASERTYRLSDCSNADYRCFVVEGLVTASVPRRCETARNHEWAGPGGPFKLVAQQTHVGLPYGSYVSQANPHAVLFFTRGNGFSRLHLTRRTPWDSGFNVNEVEIAYTLRTVDGAPLFECDPT